MDRRREGQTDGQTNGCQTTGDCVNTAELKPEAVLKILTINTTLYQDDAVKWIYEKQVCIISE